MYVFLYFPFDCARAESLDLSESSRGQNTNPVKSRACRRVRTDFSAGLLYRYFVRLVGHLLCCSEGRDCNPRHDADARARTGTSSGEPDGVSRGAASWPAGSSPRRRLPLYSEEYFVGAGAGPEDGRAEGPEAERECVICMEEFTKVSLVRRVCVCACVRVCVVSVTRQIWCSVCLLGMSLYRKQYCDACCSEPAVGVWTACRCTDYCWLWRRAVYH